MCDHGRTQQAVQGDASSWPRQPHRRRSSRPGSGSPPRRLRTRSTNPRARAATCGPRWPPSPSSRRRIHFAFAPDHFAEEWSHGLAFVVMGWAQLALGIILITRPRRWVLVAGIVGNVAIIATWAVSRTVGLPTFLGGNGEAEGVGNADLLATVLEGMIVVGSAALLAVPGLARRPIGDVRIASALAASAITLALVGASVGINPSTSGHSHGAGGSAHDAAEAEATARRPPATTVAAVRPTSTARSTAPTAQPVGTTPVGTTPAAPRRTAWPCPGRPATRPARRPPRARTPRSRTRARATTTTARSSRRRSRPRTRRSSSRSRSWPGA